MLDLDNLSLLLSSLARRLKTGHERLLDGVLHVAVRPVVHRCRGESDSQKRYV
jgi:hypothetical protein